MRSPTGKLHCDFCGKSEDVCDSLVVADTSGHGCAICAQCVLECVRQLMDRNRDDERHLLIHAGVAEKFATASA